MPKHLVSILVSIIVMFIIVLLLNTNIAIAQFVFEDMIQQVWLIESLKGMFGYTAAWGDVNDDVYPDLFFGTFSASGLESKYNIRGYTGGAEPNKLLLNNGGNTFSEVVNPAINIKAWCSVGAFADFDNDGDLDLVVSHVAWESSNIFSEAGNHKENFTID